MLQKSEKPRKISGSRLSVENALFHYEHCPKGVKSYAKACGGKIVKVPRRVKSYENEVFRSSNGLIKSIKTVVNEADFLHGTLN